MGDGFNWAVVVLVLGCIKWPEFASMPPNEWGDFLAGTFSPLALLWLVAGYRQQGDELFLNTKALLMQQVEMKNQVEEFKKLASEAKTQAESAKTQAEAAKTQAEATKIQAEASLESLRIEKKNLELNLSDRAALLQPIFNIEFKDTGYNVDSVKVFALNVSNVGACVKNLQLLSLGFEHSTLLKNGEFKPKERHNFKLGIMNQSGNNEFVFTYTMENGENGKQIFMRHGDSVVKK